MKLGGSVVTVKESPYTLDYASIEEAASTLSWYIRSGGRIALVLGGGSFGHTVVREVLSRKPRLDALDSAPIQLSMLKLSVAVVSTLLDHEVPAVLHTTHTLCGGNGCSMEPVIRDLGLGLVPVVYGDAVPTPAGAMIVSGDDLVARIAGEYGPECVLFVTRSGGVVGRGGVLREISRLEDFVDLGVEGDVTGGMRRKVEKALETARYARVVRIIGLSELKDALMGSSVGTLVRPRRSPQPS